MESVTLWEPMLHQGPGRTFGPEEREAPTAAGLLVGLVTPKGTHAGVACF